LIRRKRKFEKCKFEKSDLMGFAEKKVELFQIVANADEEMTGKLIEFAYQLRSKTENFTQEELLEWERRSEEYTKNPAVGIPMKESIARLRSNLKK